MRPSPDSSWRKFPAGASDDAVETGDEMSTDIFLVGRYKANGLGRRITRRWHRCDKGC